MPLRPPELEVLLRDLGYPTTTAREGGAILRLGWPIAGQLREVVAALEREGTLLHLAARMLYCDRRRPSFPHLQETLAALNQRLRTARLVWTPTDSAVTATGDHWLGDEAPTWRSLARFLLAYQRELEDCWTSVRDAALGPAQLDDDMI